MLYVILVLLFIKTSSFKYIPSLALFLAQFSYTNLVYK